MGELQVVGPGASRARRRDDELRLRSRSRSGKYDLPPIAPQMWHAYHVAGEQLSFTLLAALLYRFRTGKGQLVSCAVHESVSKSTEVDLMTWVMRRALVLRQTCRHAREDISPSPTIVHTKDGRWVMASLGNRADDGERLLKLLNNYGLGEGFNVASMAVPKGGRFVPGTGPVEDGPRRRAWRPCSASCARSPTRTSRGAKRRSWGCSGRRCASPTRTRPMSTGSSAAA